MRFNSVEEVREWSERAAVVDRQYHLEHGVSLNPYCTQGARARWQRGYNGSEAYPWEGDLRWDYQYQCGAAARRLEDAAQNA